MEMNIAMIGFNRIELALVINLLIEANDSVNPIIDRLNDHLSSLQMDDASDQASLHFPKLKEECSWATDEIINEFLFEAFLNDIPMTSAEFKKWMKSFME